MAQLMVVTSDHVAGYRTVKTLGHAIGLTVRARNMFSDMGASFKGLIGGEVKGYTKLLAETRAEAINRLAENAAAMGGNAVVQMRFEGTDISSNMTEIVAYGTAVVVEQDS